jgi:hypothetical protein
MEAFREPLKRLTPKTYFDQAGADSSNIRSARRK